MNTSTLKSEILDLGWLRFSGLKVIDDTRSHTLCSSSTLMKDVREQTGGVGSNKVRVNWFGWDVTLVDDRRRLLLSARMLEREPCQRGLQKCALIEAASFIMAVSK